MIKQDGGYAHYWKEEDGQGGYIDHPGMTLRDYFAAAVLTGTQSLDDQRTPNEEEKKDVWAWRRKMLDEDAKFAYMAADAMIAARDK